jgi:hypothetical protein
MNDVDVRDERLGQLLDRAVRDVQPRPDAGVPVRGGRRGRAGRVVASVAVVCVFVGAVGWAATQVGRHGTEAAGSLSAIGSLAENGWTASYPSTWHVTPVADCGVNDYHGGFVVSNVDFAFRDPQGGPPGCEDQLVAAGFPSDGVALYLMPTGIRKTVFAPPTTIFPLSLDRFERPGGIRGGPSESSQSIVVDDQLVAYAYAWTGSEASIADRSALADVVASIDYRGALQGTVYRDAGDAFSVLVPDGWQVADQAINTWVTDPREILAMATYPLRPGGHAVIDGQVPSNAMDDLGPNDLFIWVNESMPGGDGQRPVQFSPKSICPDKNCVEGRSLGIEGARAWWYYFADHGREVYVFVAMGEDAYTDPSRADQAWEILDSLTFDPLSGTFAACPSTDDALPIGGGDGAAAEDAARAFVQASTIGDDAARAALLDPAGATNNVAVSSTASDPVLASAAGSGDPVVVGGCGQAVADATWAVQIDDGTDSASLDVTLYLIHRSDGWKVWGAY